MRIVEALLDRFRGTPQEPPLERYVGIPRFVNKDKLALYQEIARQSGGELAVLEGPNGIYKNFYGLFGLDGNQNRYGCPPGYLRVPSTTYRVRFDADDHGEAFDNYSRRILAIENPSYYS